MRPAPLCRLILAVLACPYVLSLYSQPAIPEPPAILYGQVSAASPAPDLSTLSITLTGDSETLTTATPTRVVTVDGTSWFIVSIPFETRTVTKAARLSPPRQTL
jgi:hypothetical protein